jgi:hypothetical protein
MSTFQVGHSALFSYDGQFVGCGWVLDEDRIVTCAHVACPERRKPPPGTKVRAKLTAEFDKPDAIFEIFAYVYSLKPRQDAALLKRIVTSPRLSCTTTTGVIEPEEGESFSVFGFPDDFPTLGSEANYIVGPELPNGWVQVQARSIMGPDIRPGLAALRSGSIHGNP